MFVYVGKLNFWQIQQLTWETNWIKMLSRGFSLSPWWTCRRRYIKYCTPRFYKPVLFITGSWLTALSVVKYLKLRLHNPVTNLNKKNIKTAFMYKWFRIQNIRIRRFKCDGSETLNYIPVNGEKWEMYHAGGGQHDSYFQPQPLSNFLSFVT